MAYDSGQARRELLDEVASAADDLGVALAALGAAFEVLDDYNADRLEDELFRPIQSAYGRAQRTHNEFAERQGLPRRKFDAASAGLPSQGVKGFLDAAVNATVRADRTLAQLQDSMRPVDVGDAELRAGLSEVRRLVAPVPHAANELVRGLGR